MNDEEKVLFVLHAFTYLVFFLIPCCVINLTQKIINYEKCISKGGYQKKILQFI